MTQSRSQAARSVRVHAAELAESRPTVEHQNNGEEFEYRDVASVSAPVTHFANYTKGLPHDPHTGLVLNPVDYKLWLNGIQSGDTADFRLTPLGPAVGADSTKPPTIANAPSIEAITPQTLDRAPFWLSTVAREYARKGAGGAHVRAWESAAAGNVFDLQGPDAQAVTMPPAPRFDSDELVAEVAEVYAMALQRDVPFAAFPLPDGVTPDPVDKRDRTRVQTLTAACRGTEATNFANVLRSLGSLDWFNLYDEDGGYDANTRARRHFLEAESDLFRGVTPGERVGPYLSQFLLLGNDSRGGATKNGRSPADGYALYGAIGIDLRVRVVRERMDFMTTWGQYVDVQNGADLREAETYESVSARDPFQGHRFIATPRDLATYVHYDALYEAYLNACISLLAMNAPFDRGLPFLEADAFDKQQGFAHFGGPHILSLVCEVATRALKAVRYQKFNVHRRLRPEAACARVDRYCHLSTSGRRKDVSHLFDPVGRMVEGKAIGDKTFDGLASLPWEGRTDLMEAVAKHNKRNNEKHFDREPDWRNKSYLLPMAFPEGSPMHPAYGAGHGTVAGACVTILKAYFDHGWIAPTWLDEGQPVAYEPSADGSKLQRLRLDKPLTVEGELNKLAANIAIGRNWAGVHYYSDYIESMRLGEQIAIELLEEQKLTYPENFTMTIPLFDGGAVRFCTQ
ncbi:MAG: vanadium-dependent haloperoxidase [Planctomycetota bacterium]